MQWRGLATESNGDVPYDVTGDAVNDEVTELLGRLQFGSRAAATRLAILATREDGATTLDRIALAAADGSAYGLELLVELTLTNSLAGPALGRVLPSDSAAEDVTQEVLVAVSRSIHRFRGESRYTTWLYALARNVAISHLRRAKQTERLATDHNVDESGRRLSSEVAERSAIHTAIDSLPEQYRRIVFLRDIGGLSYAEIATDVGLEVSTVRSRLARGRAILTTRLG